MQCLPNTILVARQQQDAAVCCCHELAGTELGSCVAAAAEPNYVIVAVMVPLADVPAWLDVYSLAGVNCVHFAV